MRQRFLWCALVAGISCVGPAIAGPSAVPSATQLFGHIATSRTLTVAAPGPNYEVIGDLTVDPGVTLTIERGVTLRATGYADYLASGTLRGRVEIIVAGNLVVPAGQGSVLFASSTGGVGSWYGVRVVSGGTVSLADCTLLHTMVAVGAGAQTSVSLNRVAVQETIDGYRFAPECALVLRGGSVLGNFNGVGISTGVAIGQADSLSPSPTTVRYFQTGLEALAPLQFDHVIVDQCTNVIRGADGCVLYYATLLGCNYLIDCFMQGLKIYNSVLVGVQAQTNQQCGVASPSVAYFNYTDSWAGGSAFPLDPFLGGGTGVQVSSFNPVLLSDNQLSPASLFTNFSVSGGQIGAFGPGPVGPTPITAAQAIEGVSTNGRVRVVWYTNSSANPKASVYRKSEGDSWVAIGVLVPDGQGYVTYEDQDVKAGAAYAYGLGYQRGGQVGIEGVIWVTVDAPIAAFGIRSIEPNPASDKWNLSFNSVVRDVARVWVRDIAGRAVLPSLEMHSQAGANRLTIDASRLAPGLYWVGVESGGLVVASRAVKLR